VEYATSKNPTAVWVVQAHRSDRERLRCHCPGWIFKARNGKTECHHVTDARFEPEYQQWVRFGIAPSVAGESTPAPEMVAATERLLAAAAKHLPAVAASLGALAKATGEAAKGWQAFVAASGCLGGTAKPVPATGLFDIPQTGVRRIILRED
jgi:hypothetical protein